ncbi:MAG: UDP-N-acetylglucosamine--LPS N-acetylglucosamine transferase, partial [Cyanobacteria bacterium Co-bin8]|nr:UDP-N-acetylglucosamine--LPS N-acetylglucosamine transferase [Cyanobacteria bacterium Co-bin8]
MGQSVPRPWLIYALGGGWGHLNRTVALGRLAAAHSPVHILTNSPYAALVNEELERWQQQGQSVPHLIAFSATLEKAALCRQVQAQVISRSYRCLIADTFPRGLGGELADLLPGLNCPKVLIHRDLNPDYVRSHQLSEFVARHYDLVIVPGEGAVPLASLPQVRHTSPWLIYDAAELAERLAHPTFTRGAGPCAPTPAPNGGHPLILVCAAGNAAEQEFFGTLTDQLQQAFPEACVRCLAANCPPGCPPALWLQTWPGLPWIAQAT